MTEHSALLGVRAEIEMNKVVKIPYTRVLTRNIIFDIAVKAFYQKSGVLLICHIKLALALIAERAQTGNKLDIAKSLGFIKRVDSVNIISRPARQHAEDIKLRTRIFECFVAVRS